jgi:hypothetical protein
MRLEKNVELIAHHTWLHPHPFLFFVEFEDVVEIAADIHNNAIAHNLSGYAGATSTRNETGVSTTSLFNQFDDFGFVFGIGNAYGHFAIGGSIGGIGDAVEGVGEDFHVNEKVWLGSQAGLISDRKRLFAKVVEDGL